MAPKRPHKTLTLAEKHDILQKLNSGVSGKALAKKYGIGTSTISDIKKNKEKITGYIESCASSSTPMRRKSLRQPEYPEMEEKLYKWFQLQQEKNVTVNTDVLREKAIQIYSKHHSDNKFTASNGWVNRFKKRRGIHHLKTDGEKLPSDSPAVQPFAQEIIEKISELNLLPNQIYTAHESALLWKLLPNRTEQETSKERVNFLACTNSDATHKVELMVIGKTRNPTSFKNCASLPIEYHSTKIASMTSSLFVKWFHDSFVAQVQQFQVQNSLDGQAVLLVDNAVSKDSETQLTSDDGRIITMSLPPNCAPLQNVMRLIKMYYRKSLLVHTLSFEENDVSKALKNITLKDAAFLLANSWHKLSPGAIQKCWKNILCHNPVETVITKSETEVDSDHDEEEWLSENADRQEFAEIEIMLQKIFAENNQLKEFEISQWIVGDDDHLPVDSNDSSSDEEMVTEEVNVAHEEAVRSFSTCIQWAEENGIDLNGLIILRTLRQQAMETQQGCMHQTNFFDKF